MADEDEYEYEYEYEAEQDVKVEYTSWTDKYRPKNLDDIVGNRIQIDVFCKWMQRFTGESKSKHTNSITVSGHHGVGKTLTIELILKQYNFEPLYITSSNIKTYFDKTVKKTKYVKKGSIDEKDNPLVQLLFNNIDIDANKLLDNKKKAIIIADAERITLKKEMQFLISLCKSNEQMCSTPLIFVTNEQHSKLMTAIKNITMEISFQYPTLNELLMYVNMICDNEGLYFETNSLKNHMIDFVQHDIRNLLMFLEDLFDIYGSKVITLQDCKKYIKISKQKSQSNKLFPAAKILLDDYQGIKKCQDIFEQNNMVLLPLMIYENYPKNLENRQYTSGEYYDVCLDVIDAMSRSDVISTSIYTEQNWYLQRLYGFVACCETTYCLSKKPMKNRNYKIEFSKDMIDVSIQSISKKSMSGVKSILTEKSLTDILMMKKYYDNLIRLNKLKALKTSLKTYNIEDDNLPDVLIKLLKTDKTAPATKIVGKTKKYLKLLEV
jgi:replication factor C subunit 1